MEYSVFPENGILCPTELSLFEEALYHVQIRHVAEEARKQNTRFLFLAGPSCSGKTTTSLALVKALSKNGKKALTFSTDDFFFDQATAPKNADGTPNYDAFEHTDSHLLIQCIRTLWEQKTASLPLFDFFSGTRRLGAVDVSGKEYDFFIIEGIHALNDHILTALPSSLSPFCVYLDVTKGVRMEGEKEGLRPEEVRFCRRLIRDFKHRNATAERTFALWENVLSSEKEILHPFKKNASFTISTDFSYEVPVEKGEVIHLIDCVKEDSPFYEKALFLKRKLAVFPSLMTDIVPKNSVLREFID